MEVKIITSIEGFERIKEYEKDNAPAELQSILLMNDLDTFIKGNRYVVFGWDYIRWEDSFPEVVIIKEALEAIDDADYAYSLVKIGDSEDLTDSSIEFSETEDYEMPWLGTVTRVQIPSVDFL